MDSLDTNKCKSVAYPALLYPNYGSILQALAIVTLVKKYGYNCSLINYRRFINNPKPSPEELTMLQYGQDEHYHLNSNISDIEYKQIEIKALRYSFEQFNNHYFEYDPNLAHLATGGENDFNLTTSYDAFICGSDQVCNPSGGWFTQANYLQFAPKGKRISYAPSLGQNKVSLKKQKNIPLWKHYLSEMTFLSGREKRTSEVLSAVTGKKVMTVLDPTLLLSSDEWCKIVNSSELPDKFEQYIQDKVKYIVAYLLHGYAQYKEAIENFAEMAGYKIAWLVGTDTTEERGRNRVETNPGGFLKLFKNASAICTDSFHGVCFSVIFKCPFVSVAIEGMDLSKQMYDIRKYDLLERLGISNRSVTKDNFNVLLEKIDWEAVDIHLSGEIATSKNYLQNSLKSCSEYQVTPNDYPRDIKPIQQPSRPRITKSVPLNDPLNCTGCGACRNICPFDAISML